MQVRLFIEAADRKQNSVFLSGGSYSDTSLTTMSQQRK